ncbi:MAG: thermonuclease family protein [Chloroflexi bacterium]|nr:thermonuclease family protein [Chloroflexota bacterium]
MFKLFMILAVSIGILLVLIKLNSIFVLSTNLRCPDCEAIPVTRIIDGDTFVSGNTRVRLYGMDTPEIDDDCADEATERLRKLAGDTVRVERGPRTTDPFGRSLAYVYTESGLSIDELLVKEGLAVAWTRDGRHMDYLMELERETKSEGIGCLWK